MTIASLGRRTKVAAQPVVNRYPRVRGGARDVELHAELDRDVFGAVA